MMVRSLMFSFMLCGMIGLAVADGGVTVTGITAHQRYPWNGLVDIAVTLTGESNDVATAEYMFSATNSATKAAISVSHVTSKTGAVGSGTTWTKKFVWDAAADVGAVKIDDVVLIVDASDECVQLWENGPCWAKCNVGASKPEEYGYYFWWGDTVGYKRNNDEWVFFDGSSAATNQIIPIGDGEPKMWEIRVYPFGFNEEHCPTYKMDDSTLQAEGYIDLTGNLVAAHDAATVHLGAPWRMPTDAEMSALVSNCTTTWITTNGVSGRLVTGKGAFASKSIFLPAAGNGNGSYLYDAGSVGSYWSSTPYSGDIAWDLYFDSVFFTWGGSLRYSGLSVRPLRGFANCGAATHLKLDCRTGTRYARVEEPISFSTEWNDGVTRLVLNVDGKNVLSTTTATNGVYVWRPDFSTASTVTLKHTTRGATNEALTATFVVEAFDVTFDPGTHGTFNEGAETNQRVIHGEDAVAPTVTPAAGYVFTGWSSATTNITADVTCVAQYAAIPYTITYENLHGATNPNPSTYTVEDAFAFAAPGSVARRQFVRWEPESVVAGTTGALTVCAVWEDVMPCIYVDAANGNDANDGSTADLAVKTLVRAYELAEAGDVVRVAAGTYEPLTATGKAVTFRATDGATIDGGGTDRCVTADADVVFENFTLVNGYDATQGGGAYGGTFEGCVITNCTSDWDGGGAYDAILRNCLIVDNTAENGWGGGVYGGSLSNCVVRSNTAGDEGGGAYAPTSVLDTMFSGNSPENVSGDAGTVTSGTSFVYEPSDGTIAYSIPHDWFVAKGLAKEGGSTAELEAALAATQANGYTGWESYVAGLDPTNAASVFTATVTISNGMVVVGWTPNLNEAATKRIYTLSGRTDIGTDDWETPVKAWHRFFRVTVEMPTGAADEESAVPGQGFVPEEENIGGVQLWENGPYWAECNVGASKPEEYGYYFWWGDTVGYKRDGGTWSYNWEYYSGVTWVSSEGTRMSSSPFDSSSCPTYGKDNSTLQSLGYIDSTGNLVAAHDAATAHLGAPWRMPTDAEMSALVSNCTTTWITTNGVSGRLVTGKGAYASKSIFLPAAGLGLGSYLDNTGSDGYYWSSTPYSVNSYYAWYLYFGSGYFYRYDYYRYCGQSVRPLRGFAK